MCNAKRKLKIKEALNGILRLAFPGKKNKNKKTNQKATEKYSSSDSMQRFRAKLRAVTIPQYAFPFASSDVAFRKKVLSWGGGGVGGREDAKVFQNATYYITKCIFLESLASSKAARASCLEPSNSWLVSQLVSQLVLGFVRPANHTGSPQVNPSDDQCRRMYGSSCVL